MAPAHKRQKLSDGHAADAAVTSTNGTQTCPAKTTASSNGVLQASAEDRTSAQTAPQTANRSLFVRSLPTSTTSQSLTELFSESYPIKHATAVLDKETKLCRGFGFVTFADPEDAERARAEFNGFVLEGKKLRVEIAEKRNREAKDEDSHNKTNGDVEEVTTIGDDTLVSTVSDTQVDDKAKAKHGRHGMEKDGEGQQSRLIVRNLPWTIKTSDQLSKLFLSYGKVKQAYIPKKGPGLSSGFGFVVLRGRKNAEKALEGVNGKEIDGRTLAVDWAVTKDVYENALKEEKEADRLAKAQAKLDAKAASAKAGEIDDEHDEDDDDGGIPLDGASDYDEGDLGELEDDDASDGTAGSDEGDEDADMDDDADDEPPEPQHDREDRSSTLFIRNLPFTCDDEGLEDFFTQFGAIRYARVVMDHATERSKGTGFVCFYSKDEADECLKAAPRKALPAIADEGKHKSKMASQSILQNEDSDPSGKYTLEGRVLQIARAVDKSEANRLTEEGTTYRNKRDKDKRRLYLLSEGTIATNSKLWEQLPPSERTMREASAKQRKQLIESNPSLHLSLTRLSVRNLPRSVDSKQLKALAREAVVGFAKDVKEGKRQRLSAEEVARGGDEMIEAEKARKQAGKGLVKQTKVVFEAQSGSKVSEEAGAGRSRGYGFIEYHTHRSALMGLRWLNGHAIGYQVKDNSKGGLSKEDIQDRKKRMIVEFAIENAQVVLRRKDRENKARERSKTAQDKAGGDADGSTRNGRKGVSRQERHSRGALNRRDGEKSDTRKRKRSSSEGTKPSAADEPAIGSLDEKLARRNRIIGRKRAVRKARKGAK